MSNKDYEELTLDSEVFSDARSNFDLFMQDLLQKMKNAESNEGTINLKITLNLVDDRTETPDGDTISIKRPVIKHDVSTTVPLKKTLTSKKDIRKNLIWSNELKRFVLTNIMEGEQRSIFDPDFEDNMKNGEAAEDSEQDPNGSNALPGPTNALPDPDEPIDADFIDVPDEDTEEPENADDEDNSDDYAYDDPEDEEAHDEAWK